MYKRKKNIKKNKIGVIWKYEILFTQEFFFKVQTIPLFEIENVQNN